MKALTAVASLVARGAMRGAVLAAMLGAMFGAMLGFSAGCAGHARGVTAPRAFQVGAAIPAATSRDGLLAATGDAVWRGDLAAAEVALTALADRERGRADTALDFWSELLALLRCEPLARVPRVDRVDVPLGNPWERLRRLVQIERVRLGRALPELPKVARMIARSDARPAGSSGLREVVWPVEGEHWNDEVAVPVLITRCLPASGASAVGTASAPAGDSEIALVAATARAMPSDHPATAPLLLQAAVLELGRGRPGAAIAALSRFDAVGARDGALAPSERSDAVFTDALAAVADPSVAPERALALARAAFRLDCPPVVRRSLALLLAERLVATKRPDDAVAILGAPPHGDDAIGRYIAFRQAEAYARSGHRAELLAEAREALHRHDRAEVDADPALGAMMDMALRTLQASPVSPETMEIWRRSARRANGSRARRASPRWRSPPDCTPRRWRRTAGSTTTTPTPNGDCSTWPGSAWRRRGPARAPSSPGPSSCSPVRRSLSLPPSPTKRSRKRSRKTSRSRRRGRSPN